MGISWSRAILRAPVSIRLRFDGLRKLRSASVSKDQPREWRSALIPLSTMTSSLALDTLSTTVAE